MSDKTYHITLIKGDGVGPEVVEATRRIIDATGVKIEWEERLAGAEVFKQGLATGVPQETIDSIARTKVVLKGPLETPVGYGEKSANVTLRKRFETYGNIRPVVEMPNVISPFQGRGIDLVIIRENVEDLYAGVEHMQTPGVAHSLKIISRKGCEKIVRLAFEFARSQGRKKVHCATKANIMKLSEGLLKRTFEEIAPEYPDIEAQHIIVDNCAHQLVLRPENFDIIVTTNMNGDILSDLCSALVGGLGFAPSANIGNDVAIFEAVHGSAPKYAGQNTINPTALLMSGMMMLRHLGEFTAANKIENSLLYTMAVDKILTRDALLGKEDQGVSTTAFTDAIIKNIDKKYEGYQDREYHPIKLPQTDKRQDFVQAKKVEIVGFDIFVEWSQSVEALGKGIEELIQKDSTLSSLVKLKLISTKGMIVYPEAANSDLIDHFCCRVYFQTPQKEGDAQEKILPLLNALTKEKYHWGHIEKLAMYDDKAGFTKAHGEA